MEQANGRSYSLPEGDEYFSYVAGQVDILCAKPGGLARLDALLTNLITSGRPAEEGPREFELVFAGISALMSSAYTPQLPAFLATVPADHDDFRTFGITARGYHLRMLHIEVMNRVMREDYRRAAHKVVILPHCLRDFRDEYCRFEPGDVDYLCGHCTEDCLINQTGSMLTRYPDYHLYISQNLDLEEVFALARKKYGDTGLLGVACVPELHEGMLLSRKMGIPAQGVLLNYNRCRRWTGAANFTSFNLAQLIKVIETIG